MKPPVRIRTGVFGVSLTMAIYVASALWIWGCTDRRAVSQLPQTHPASWMQSGYQDFHGAVVLQNGAVSCTECHGDDYNGGKVGVSCIACHLTSGACAACHGGLDNGSGAPPYGLRGETDDTARAVGAHTVHLSGTLRSAAVACSSCHLVPASMFEPTHLNTDGGVLDSIAEITWQGFADGGGATWSRSARTCTGTYCHGNFTGGKPSNAPIWTSSEEAPCGSCHDVGFEPATLGPVHQIHLSGNALLCTDCHAAVVDSSLTIITPTLHVNGVADVTPPDQVQCDECHGTGPDACTHCHGGLNNLTGAPPRGLRGETSGSTRAVGAHTTHVEANYVSVAFSCNECHLVPTRLTDPGHWGADSTAEITWGPLAGSASSWDRGTGECSNTYCHGNFPGGYTGNTPIWTAASQAACGSCHDDGTRPSDLSGRHQKHVIEEHVECYECHSATVDASLLIIGKSVHVDGQKTVAFGARRITYSDGSCSGPDLCHETESWR